MTFRKIYRQLTVPPMLTALSLACVMTSCFTGVESTPKIGNSELKHQNVGGVTAEQLYLADIKPQTFAQWQPGKEFLVTDGKIEMIFSPLQAPVEFNEGDIISYAGSREVVAPTGTAVELLFKKEGFATPLAYKINATLDELRERQEVEIPFAVELEISEKVRSRLVGNRYYITTPRWRDENGDLVTRVKYIPVEIESVVPGNYDFPVRIIFKPEYKGLDPHEYYSVFMSVGDGARSTRNFETLFALKNPRDKYTSITDSNWTAIIENRVTPGMTREEARLALGSPNDVDRGHDYSSVYEKWIYDGGVYLIFRDGLLESFRR